MICGFQFQAERVLLCADCRDSAPIISSVFPGFFWGTESLLHHTVTVVFRKFLPLASDLPSGQRP